MRCLYALQVCKNNIKSKKNIALLHGITSNYERQTVNAKFFE
ncbi:hypothetical protein PPEP_b1193 [Pseudoalteromonas peptidolytica F12-50-A1]|uniref:Uncharacterized protein n=1 Tax=Pseudoalteromonas peptidolytica F12-50-A1 TaxID=1315280 RepID=A0A8I0T7A7_9GAMM|nr:hypothetical protein [Pseudoalteromonas peptidolytica F12-50-A1]